MAKVNCRFCNRLFRTHRSEPSRNACCSFTCFNVIGPTPIVTTNTDNIQPKILLPVVERSHRKNGKRNKHQRTRHERFFKSGAWLDLRYRVLSTYGRRCMCCGDTKGTMEVDHIIPRSQRADLALKFSNLQVLCRACNQGKLDRYTHDFRPDPQLVPKTPVIIKCRR